VIFRNLLRVCGYAWLSTDPLRLIEIEYMVNFQYKFNLSQSQRNCIKPHISTYSQKVPGHHLSFLFFLFQKDREIFQKYQFFTVNSISINLKATLPNQIHLCTHKRSLDITSASFSFYFKEIKKYFKNIKISP
jgi:hypothetical protein